ncbi:MAG TPA: hypothetical protein VJ571_03485 [Candidatus Nitrosotalea sp.]|nr:hypothetical protein [Candidatus Nitrosotalea sp.]
MEKSKTLSLVIIVAIILIASGIGFFYVSESTQSVKPDQSALPTNVHHFQVNVNDTFVIGEKHS